jgi:hypothetical protein
MKKIIALALFVIPCFAFAQFNKGQVFLGGVFSASVQSSPSSNGSTTKNNSVSITPNIGFFLNQKFSVGATIGYSTSFQEFDYVNFNSNTGTFTSGFQKYKLNGIVVGSFVRYYTAISTSFYFALQGQAIFNRSTMQIITNDGLNESNQQTPSYSIGINVKPVFIYFPSTKWGIEAGVGSLSYNHTRILPNVSSGDNLLLNVGSFSFGLAYYFARK